MLVLVVSHSANSVVRLTEIMIRLKFVVITRKSDSDLFRMD